MCISIYIYKYGEREREREIKMRRRERQTNGDIETIFSQVTSPTIELGAFLYT